MTSAVPGGALRPSGDVPAPQAEDAVYGLLRLAGTDVALPLAVLREVVHCPMDLAPLPSSALGLLGAMSLRSTVLPVVDLRPVLGREVKRADDQVVVVVACTGQVFGLLADEVRGVTRLSSAALLPVRAEGGGLLCSHTFQHPEDGTVISVLDAPAILRATGVPTVADTTRSSGTGTAAEVVARRTRDVRKLTVVRCGAHLLALDVAHVHTTLPPPVVRPSVLDSGLCRGVTDFADREVPVVDPLVLFGLGAMTSEEVGAGLVLDLGHGYVVLALTALLDLVETPSADVLDLPVRSAGTHLLAAVAEIADAGSCLVVDGAALTTVPELVSLASVNTARGRAAMSGTTAVATAGEVAGSGRAYLTYSAGAELTTPLDQVLEILPFPPAITAIQAAAGVLGVVIHRRSAVPVLRLTDLLGQEHRSLGDAACLLLVAASDDGAGGPGDLVAFAVDRLHAIEPLAWVDPDHAPAPAGDRARLLHTARLVRVGSQNKMLAELDLCALAASLTSEFRPVPRHRADDRSLLSTALG